LKLVGLRKTSPSEIAGNGSGSALGQDAALYGLQHLGKVAVAVVEARRRVTNADDRPGEHLVGVAHRLRERPVEIARECRVVVAGEAAIEPAGGLVSGMEDAQLDRTRRWRIHFGSR
jgi:hypothetical protein